MSRAHTNALQVFLVIIIGCFCYLFRAFQSAFGISDIPSNLWNQRNIRRWSEIKYNKKVVDDPLSMIIHYYGKRKINNSMDISLFYLFGS